MKIFNIERLIDAKVLFQSLNVPYMIGLVKHFVFQVEEFGTRKYPRSAQIITADNWFHKAATWQL